MVLISVESRKGGVGKTTAALSLADVLLRRGYEVLMVDLDIIGTSIDKRFFTANKETIHEVSRNAKAVNLLRLFKQLFMAGHNVPAFAPVAEAGTNYLTFEKGKCNIIGSNIYEKKEDAFYKKKKDQLKNEDDVKLIEDPRILYDSFHAYWILEMVKEIAKSFCLAIGKESKVAVILDNSPGFSSIEKVVNDYLTNIGPEKGKLLMVATIDPQDMDACRQSMASIEKLFDDKLAAGNYYHSMMEEGRGEERDSDAFNAVWNSLCASNGRLPEYYASMHERHPIFANILVNKVPRIIHDKLYRKGILKMNQEEAAPFLNHLLYFFSNPLLCDMEIIHPINLSETGNKFFLSCDIAKIASDEEKYQGLIDFLKNAGLTGFFNKEWSPMYPFKKILDYLKEQEVLKEKGSWQIPYPDLPLRQVADITEKELETVCRFVLDNLVETASLKDILDEVVAFVKRKMRETGSGERIDFHPDTPAFAEWDEFVVHYGLAFYRLYEYEKYCSLINSLAKYCLENVERMETLDKDAIDKRITELFEGERKVENESGELAGLLANHRNARELNEAVERIVKSWEL